MNEFNSPQVINHQKLQSIKILKDSWFLSKKYFTALVVPFFIITIPSVFVVFALPGKSGENLSNVISAILWPIAAMGTHRSLLLLKTDNIDPTFTKTFAEGCDYWWRGIKINIVKLFYLIPVLILCVLLIAPATYMVGKNDVLGSVLMVIALVVSAAFFAWFFSRSCLVLVVMADNQTSATKSFNQGWEMTKGRTSEIQKIALVLIGFFLVSLFLIVAVSLAIHSVFGNDPLIVIPSLLLLWIIYAYCLTYIDIVCNLIYQTLKPLGQNQNKGNFPTNI